jgi:hypothetical protein
MANAFFIRLATAPSRLPRLPSSPQPCPSTPVTARLGRRFRLFRGAAGKKHDESGAQHGSFAQILRPKKPDVDPTKGLESSHRDGNESEVENFRPD